MFNGLGMSLGTLSRLSSAVTRSICAENFTGEKGKAAMADDGTGVRCARELGRGWKVSPSIRIEGKTTFTLGEIQGSGAIQHIWMTTDPRYWRSLVLRIYWDGEETPSVEVPVGDFFCNGWCERVHVHSLPVAVNPAGAFNCYWEMPFRKSARVTMESLIENPIVLYYQIDYTLTEVPDDAAYFHALFHRDNPLPYQQDHVILPKITGKGQYVGTYIAWGVNNNGWWGEGEVKFFIDGDGEYPTICSTGTEDYFGGAWDFEYPQGEYCSFDSPFTGFHQVAIPDKLYHCQQRFGMHRWHVMDPVRFEKDLRVTIQALGWRSEGRYLPLQDDIASTAFWYQTEPHAAFPVLPDANGLEVI